MIRGLGAGRTTLDLLCERETIFQRLPQTTPEKLCPNLKKYSIDPQVRVLSTHSTPTYSHAPLPTPHPHTRILLYPLHTLTCSSAHSTPTRLHASLPTPHPHTHMLPLPTPHPHTRILLRPQTRYPNLTFHRIRPKMVKHLYDAGFTADSPALRSGSIKVKRTADAAGTSNSRLYNTNIMTSLFSGL